VSASTWYIAAAGAGPGETSLACAVARAAVARGHQVVAWADSERNAELLGEAAGEARLLRDPAHLAQAAEDERPAVVALASSLTCAPYLAELVTYPGWVAAIETSWMPWAPSLGTLSVRLDQIVALLPPEVWEGGLVENGGPFEVARHLQLRSFPAGWMGGGEAGRPAQDTVVLYLGQKRDPATAARGPVWSDAVGPAIELVAQRRPELSWVLLGTLELQVPSFVERRAWVSSDEFVGLLSSSALLIAHHGMGTIQKALVAGTPVLSLTNGTIFRCRQRPPWSADQEMHVLHRLGLVEACHGPAPPTAIARRALALIAEGRREPQPAGGGEAGVRAIEAAIGRR